MSNLTIYKASAGSGKTFRLALEYIKMVINNPLSYRGILAVTFTNKATTEMKERILYKLFNLSKGLHDDFFNTVLAETKLSPQSITLRASEALSNILHDYSMFNISTIDSFVQRVIKNLLWEFGFHSNSEIQLDFKPYIEKAVDRMLDQSGDNAELFEFFRKMITDSLDEEESSDIRKVLIDLGETLFAERFRMLSDKEKETMDNHQILQQVEQYIDNVCADFTSKLNSYGTYMLNEIQANGLEFDDFANKSRGVGGFFVKLRDFRNGNNAEGFINSYVQKAIDSADGWLTKSEANRKPDVYNLIVNTLYPKLLEISTYLNENCPLYNTALIIGKDLSTLRVINNIRRNIKEILNEENSMLLADSGPLLRQFVGANDAPFVYEKIGTRYQNFMLDEFQDTSEIQWLNFKPLITNSLSEDNFSLVVGDVKQAIYRWRNSDWRILARGVEDDFEVNKMSLDTNFRSLPKIVDFNNNLFTKISASIPQWTTELCEGNVPQKLKELVEKVYESPEQKIALKNSKNVGYVEVSSISGSSREISQHEDGFLKSKFNTIIPDLLERGISLGDIAILVRTKKEGTKIAEMLLSQGVSVMSQDALMLANSHSVQLCVAAFKLINNANDNLSLGVLAKEMNHFMQNTDEWGGVFMSESLQIELQFLQSLKNQPLITMFESVLSHYGINSHPSELPYIAFIHEIIIEHSRSGAASLMRFIEWWDEVGSELTLKMPESLNAVNILTIHKSKGLQFPVVIVPFMGIENKKRKKSKIWTRVDIEPYSRYPLYPLKYSKIMKYSTLRMEYIEEQVQLLVDNLNLLYVANTRPEKELYIMLSLKEGKNKHDDSEIVSLSKAVVSFVRSMPNVSIEQNSVDELSISTYTFGEKGSYATRTEVDDSWSINTYSVENKLPKIATQLESLEFFKSSASGVTDKIEYGKVMHRLFSLIVTTSDIGKALYELCIEGLIAENEKVELEQSLGRLLSKAPFYEWFSGKWQVKSEQSIINTDGSIYRPDRVMLHENEAIVVDFKFGQPSDKHSKQVSNYMSLISDMGYTHVTGFVWYVDSNELVEVVGYKNIKF